MFVSALGWSKGWTWLRKDLLDFNFVGAGTNPNSGCFGSVDWHSLSTLLAVSLLILDGTIFGKFETTCDGPTSIV